MRLLLASLALLAACAAPPELDVPDDGGARPGFAASADLRAAQGQTLAALDPRDPMAARIAALRARAAAIRGDIISPELRARIEARRALQ